MDMKAWIANEAERSSHDVICDSMEFAVKCVGRRVALCLAAEALGRLEQACKSIGEQDVDLDELIGKNREAGRVAQQELTAEARFGKQATNSGVN